MFGAEFSAQEGSWVKTFLRPRLLLLVAALTPVILALQQASTNAQMQGERPLRRAPAYVSEKEKMNAWTVGLAGGLLEGAPIRLLLRLPTSSMTDKICMSCPLSPGGDGKSELASLSAWRRYGDHQFRRARGVQDSSPRNPATHRLPSQSLSV